ncbi:ABC transporter ATP-binding protein [Novispirillum sp. DQ9]|uniref:ABC transporter ATP-binding protein n=1 Tax=Novispirillum sp. DQ9 TaxID=3398612 RepID=UPI003C7BF1F0
MHEPPPVSTMSRSEREKARWVFSFVRPHGRALAWIALTSLFGAGVGLAQPWVTKLLIDDALLAGNGRLLVTLAAVMVGIAVLSSALGALNRWVYISASGRILFAMRARVYDHLLTLSPRFFARHRTGDIMSRLDGDIGEVLRFGVDAPLAAFNAVLMLAGALTFMILLDPALTALALALLPVQVYALRRMRPLVERTTLALRERSADISSFLVRSLGAVRVIQSFTAERRERAALDGLGDHYLRDLLRLQMVNHAAGAIPGLSGSLGNAAVFVAGGFMVLDGSLTLGGLIAFTAYLGRATGPVQSLLGLYVGVQRARTSLNRVLELLDARPDVTAPATPAALPAPVRGALELRGVTFAHAEAAAPVLHALSLSVPAGGKVVICGPSGAGKSTLISLLHRHFDPDAGSILLDGVDLRALDPAEVRRHVAVMEQEVVLFPGTIADNVRYGRPDATDAEVAAALAAAQLSDACARLPQGLHTPVGEAGALFSGGERQRIALARCLIRAPAVLILDEPTSALDPTAARALAADVDRLFAGRTRIVVTHRNDFAEGADQTLRLDGGVLARVEAAA